MGSTDDKWRERRCIDRVQSYERSYAANEYRGRGWKALREMSGNTDLALVALHTVQMDGDPQTLAQHYAGALTQMLAWEIGCPALCVARSQDADQLEAGVRSWLQGREIHLLVELEVRPLESAETVVRVAIAGNRSDFVGTAIRYSMEYQYGRADVVEVVPVTESICRRVSVEHPYEYVHLVVNERSLHVEDGAQFLQAFDALCDTLRLLSHIEWDAREIKVYKLWKSNTHKPQDKVEICDGGVSYNRLMNISAYHSGSEKVRSHKVTPDAEGRFYKDHPDKDIREYIFLTNRLIESLAHEMWEEDRHAGMPIVVYEDHRKEYGMGLPKADQVDRIYLSTRLYNACKEESRKYDYVVYNRYTDSMLYIDYDKADYQDNGRVESERVMVPRYYKRLLGYLDYPLRMIRAGEYYHLADRMTEQEREAFEACYEPIPGEIFYRLRPDYEAADGVGIDVSDTVKDLLRPQSSESTELKHLLYDLLLPELRQDGYPTLFGNCSIEDDLDIMRTGSEFRLAMKDGRADALKAKIPDIEEQLKQIRIQVTELIEAGLAERYGSDQDAATMQERAIRQNKTYAAFALGRLGVYARVELRRERKETAVRKPVFCRLRESLDQLWVLILQRVIGKADYLLKVEWCSETDDRNNVARLNANMMNLLGVSENDKIFVQFGKRHETIRVLANEELSDYQIGIPATARKNLGMSSINDIVIVHRDMKHIFSRHSEEQAITVLGTVLAVFQVIPQTWLGILVSLVTIPIILYLILNVERVKVR